jgi:hypothetical protein
VSGGALHEWREGAVAVARRPDLWPTALIMAWRLVPRRRWRRWPSRRDPASSYLAFRRQTFSGRTDTPIGSEDLVAYLEWCRRMHGRLG